MIFHVPDISCGHCKASITAALSPIAAPVAVDIAARLVTVADTADSALVLQALADIGFPAQIVANP